MKALDEINPLSAFMGVFPSVWPVFVRVGKIFGASGPKGLQSILDYVDARIAQVQRSSIAKSESDPLDFIERLSSAKTASTHDMRLAANANMLAGSDTTTISLTAILYHVLKNPAVLSKLQHELDEAVKDGRMSSPITFKEAQALSYLQAVIKEGLRVHPATGFTMPRVVPAGGAVFAGQFLPEGVSRSHLRMTIS